MGDSFWSMTSARLNLGDDIIKKLFVDQEPALSRDTRQIAEFMVRGRYPIALGVNPLLLSQFQKQGLGKNLKTLHFPEMDTFNSSSSVVWLLNRAPHPSAAKVFINWLLTKDAQVAWAREVETNSRRLGVEPGNPQYAVPRAAKLLQVDAEENLAEVVKPHMTVFENVAYPLELRGLPRAVVREKVARVLDLVGLGGTETRPGTLLSGGQMQRLALCRALVYEPDLLLLDEPFSNLDAKLREQMRMEVKLLQRRLGITVLFVTHDQVEALSLSDRIAVMHGGRVEQVGSPRCLYEEPASAFVRDFLGQTVILHGQVGTVGSGAADVTVSLNGSLAGCTLVGRRAPSVTLTQGALAQVTIRPEDIEVDRAVGRSEAGRAPTNPRPGIIDTISFL